MRPRCCPSYKSWGGFINMYMKKCNIINLIKFWQHFALVFEVHKNKSDHSFINFNTFIIRNMFLGYTICFIIDISINMFVN